MEGVWGFVTPTTKGIPTTKMFYEGVLLYAKVKGLNIKYEFIDLPEDTSRHPKLSYVLSFLEEALEKDVPTTTQVGGFVYFTIPKKMMNDKKRDHGVCGWNC